MSELKTCPFCGGDRKHSDDCYITMLVEYVEKPMFFENDYEKKLEEAWNTRAERTCSDVETRCGYWECSECGAQLDNPYECPTLWVDNKATWPSYCPNCGAKVVGE